MPVTRNDVNDRRQVVSQHGDSTLRIEQERDRLREELRDSPKDDVDLNSTHVVYGLLTLAVFGIDVLLFAPIAAFIVGNAFPDSPQMATAAKFLLPLCVMVLELALAMRIHEAAQEMNDDELAIADINGEAELHHRRCWWMGAVFVAFMPLLAISTQVAELGSLMSRGTELNAYLQSSLLIKAAALGLLAYVPHALFIFGGENIVEAKSALLNYFSTSLEEELQRADEEVQGRQRDLADAFNDYHHALTAYNESSDYPMAAGPFREKVRQLINRVYGREILQAPPDAPVGPGGGDGAVGPNEPPAPGPRPSAAPDGADSPDRGRGNGESDDSALFEQRRRNDADGTLRP